MLIRLNRSFHFHRAQVVVDQLYLGKSAERPCKEAITGRAALCYRFRVLLNLITRVVGSGDRKALRKLPELPWLPLQSIAFSMRLPLLLSLPMSNLTPFRHH